MKPPLRDTKRVSGFTLLELLVSMAIFILLAALMLTVTTEAGRMWQQSEGQKNRRQAARIILETISRDLQGAAFPVGTHLPGSLAFLVNPAIGAGFLRPNAAFWQTRSQQDSLGMADVGYFVRKNGAVGELCRIRIPAGDPDSIFSNIDRTISSAVLDRLAPGTGDNDLKGLLAENVLGFWFVLRDNEGVEIPLPYDSRTTAIRPTFVDVGIVLIDARTARKIREGSAVEASYSLPMEDFVDALPTEIRQGVQTFTSRIRIHANR